MPKFIPVMILALSLLSFYATAQNPAKQPLTLRLLTYNSFLLGINQPTGRLSNRANAMISQLDNFDIVALQELFDGDQQHQFSTQLFKRYPHQVSGVPVGSWFDINGGLALFSKYALHDITAVDWQAHDGWDSWSNKGFVYTRIHLVDDVYLSLLNLHMQANDKADIRHNQIKQIKDFMRRNVYDKYPKDLIVYVGDFNIAGPTIRGNANEEYDTMIETLSRGTLLDSWRQVNNNTAAKAPCGKEPGFTYFPQPTNQPGWCPHNTLADNNDQNARLDYILVDDHGFKQSGYRLLLNKVNILRFQSPPHPNNREYLSDHFGLATTLTIDLPL
ncbi:MAG: sphingomyelin phosphodiesterase [Algicola sp.]|nr:sphingomyelin phosphodiesterase [Algicola sp.]